MTCELRSYVRFCAEAGGSDDGAEGACEVSLFFFFFFFWVSRVCWIGCVSWVCWVGCVGVGGWIGEGCEDDSVCLDYECCVVSWRYIEKKGRWVVYMLVSW